MSHTPGPWKWETNWRCAGSLKGAFVDNVGNTCRIADVESQGGVGNQETCEANARLIAAAPDLLAACIALQMEAAARGCGLRIADEAIAKAKGLT